MTTDRRETYRCHKAAHEAYVRGDLDSLREALSNPPDFPNCRQPFDMAVGDHPLEYAIYYRALHRFGLKPAEALFIDDREVNVQGALAVGMAAHLFTSADDLRRRLEAEALL